MKLLSRICLLMVLVNWTVYGNSQNKLSSSNPFYNQSKLAYQAAAFNNIKNGDFKPAFEEGMRVHLQEIRKIADNPALPTFENTFVAMEKSGRLLDRVNKVFNLLTGANTNDELQKIQEEVENLVQMLGKRI